MEDREMRESRWYLRWNQDGNERVVERWEVKEENVAMAWGGKETMRVSLPA